MLHNEIAKVVEILRKFHVEGGEQYDPDNLVDAEFLASYLESLLDKNESASDD